MLSQPWGIPKNCLIGRGRDMFPEERESVRIMDRKRKGNREGMTDRRHSMIPFCAPMSAVLLSKIKRSIQINVEMLLRSDFLDIDFTSEECMQL